MRHSQAIQRPPAWRVFALRTIPIAILYVIVTAGAIIFSIPMLWTLSSSLKDTIHIFTQTVQWIPDPVHWENYVELFTRLPFVTFIWNTLIIVVNNVIATIITASLAGYAFARLRAPGRD